MDRTAGTVVEQPVGVEGGDDLGIRAGAHRGDGVDGAEAGKSIQPEPDDEDGVGQLGVELL